MYLFFDTETDGLPIDYKAPVSDLQNWPRLVQIAWIVFDEGGDELERQDFIIKPDGFVIPKEASDIHGITNKKAIKEGYSLEVVLEEFNSRLELSDNLVAHNISFDEKIVGAEFLRMGMKNMIPRKKRICTMKSTSEYVGIPGFYGDYKWPKLTELHERIFGYEFDEEHNAAADVDATARCFWKLKQDGLFNSQNKYNNNSTFNNQTRIQVTKHTPIRRFGKRLFSWGIISSIVVGIAFFDNVSANIFSGVVFTISLTFGGLIWLIGSLFNK